MFENVKKNFGFGCMRLPMVDGSVNYQEFNKMIDEFIENGFNYFDTAHGYLDGRSETAMIVLLVVTQEKSLYLQTN